MRIAVIDIGTNTFNLLIAEKTGETGYTILHSSKAAVRLSKGSAEKKELKSDAITRGLNALEKFHLTMNGCGVEKVFAFATAAVRNAKNNIHFINAVKDRFDLDVTVLEGNKEAEYVYLGVRQAYDLSQKCLILDIGGGSLEFIIADNNTIYWKKSYQTGVTYLLDKFNPSDPISIEEMEYINNFFEERLSEVFEQSKNHGIDTLIGASGAFESFEAMLREADKFESETSLKPSSSPIDKVGFDELFWQLVNSTQKERKRMKGLEAMRVEFIVLAALLVKFLIDKLKLKHLYQANCAMKEGIMFEIMNERLK